MNYPDAVAEARKLVKRSEEDQWRLAELTFEQTEGSKSVREWAGDIGVSSAHAGFLRKVWSVYRVDTDRPAFADAYAQVKGLPVDREERRGMEARSTIRSMPIEQQAEVVKEALADPEVAREVVRNTNTSASITRARMEVAQQHAESYEAQMQEDYPETLALQRFEQSLGKLNTARYSLASGLEIQQKITLSDAQREMTSEQLEATAAVIDWWRSYITHGAKATDEAIANLLEGGA